MQVEPHVILGFTNDRTGRHDLAETLARRLQVVGLIHKLTDTAANGLPTTARFKRIHTLVLWSVTESILWT